MIDGVTNNAKTTVSVGLSLFRGGEPGDQQDLCGQLWREYYLTVIDGATNFITTVHARSIPRFCAVNPVTNQIYVSTTAGTRGSANVTVIDGATNATTTVAPPLEQTR